MKKFETHITPRATFHKWLPNGFSEAHGRASDGRTTRPLHGTVAKSWRIRLHLCDLDLFAYGDVPTLVRTGVSFTLTGFYTGRDFTPQPHNILSKNAMPQLTRNSRLPYHGVITYKYHGTRKMKKFNGTFHLFRENCKCL